MTSLGRSQQSLDLTITTAGGLVGRRALGAVENSRGPRKKKSVDYGMYSARPDAQAKRLKYALDEEYREKVLSRTSNWRAGQRKLPAWRAYDLMRNQVVRKRHVIERMEKRLETQREKLVLLCREAAKLKRDWQRQKKQSAG